MRRPTVVKPVDSWHWSSSSHDDGSPSAWELSGGGPARRTRLTHVASKEMKAATSYDRDIERTISSSWLRRLSSSSSLWVTGNAPRWAVPPTSICRQSIGRVSFERDPGRIGRCRCVALAVAWNVSGKIARLSSRLLALLLNNNYYYYTTQRFTRRRNAAGVTTEAPSHNINIQTPLGRIGL